MLLLCHTASSYVMSGSSDTHCSDKHFLAYGAVYLAFGSIIYLHSRLQESTSLLDLPYERLNKKNRKPCNCKNLILLDFFINYYYCYFTFSLKKNFCLKPETDPENSLPASLGYVMQNIRDLMVACCNRNGVLFPHVRFVSSWCKSRLKNRLNN